MLLYYCTVNVDYIDRGTHDAADKKEILRRWGEGWSVVKVERVEVRELNE